MKESEADDYGRVSTFAWNASPGRVKYVAVFPFLSVVDEFWRAKTARSR
jgi:hypothetical protein